MPGIKRRNFLQGLGATALAGSLTGLVPRSASAMHSYGANPVLLNKRAGVVKYHSCLRNCADRCLMKFRVQDGRMTYVSGAEEQFKTGSCPCVKGLTYVEYTYAPDRILHPMERIGEKGSHKWRRISWEEAWDKLIKKTHEVIDKYGSEAILPYSYSGNYGAIGSAQLTVSSTASALPTLTVWSARKPVSGVTAVFRAQLTAPTLKRSPTATATSPGALTKPYPTCTASNSSTWPATGGRRFWP